MEKIAKEELLSLKVGDKVTSSVQSTRNKYVRNYYEVIAVHEGNRIVAKRNIETDIILKYCEFNPRTLFNTTGELIDEWFRYQGETK